MDRKIAQIPQYLSVFEYPVYRGLLHMMVLSLLNLLMYHIELHA